MASSAQKSDSDVKLSPRETRLFSTLKPACAGGSWVTSQHMTESEYGRIEAKWPRNARQIVTGTMIALASKLDDNGSRRRIIKRGGGRAGIEYKMELRK